MNIDAILILGQYHKDIYAAARTYAEIYSNVCMYVCINSIYVLTKYQRK